MPAQLFGHIQFVQVLTVEWCSRSERATSRRSSCGPVLRRAAHNAPCTAGCAPASPGTPCAPRNPDSLRAPARIQADAKPARAQVSRSAPPAGRGSHSARGYSTNNRCHLLCLRLVIKDRNNKKAGKINLPDEIFGLKAGQRCYAHSVINFLANQRQGDCCNEDKGSWSAAAVKPWKQKSTGRARAGSIQSPLWRSGGTAFGSQPRITYIPLQG